MGSQPIPLVEIKEMYKQFAGNPVLKGISLSLNKGEIHAIVGGNGAGKSTLMKIITGLYKADDGQVSIKGKQAHFSSTFGAHLSGVYLVPQEPLIFPNMTIEENITIGLPGSKSNLKEKVENIINKLGWKLNLHQSALTLSIAEQQLIEITRGLAREAEILILDEPTSTLTFGEIESLFQTIKQLTSEGLGVFYITHRLPEIFQLANKVSILRDGIISAQGNVSEFTYDRLLAGLLPENMSQNKKQYNVNVPITKQAKNKNSNHLVLRVNHLSGKRFNDITFTLNSGEILGIAGVVGAGRTELAEAIFGLTDSESGDIFLNEINIKKLSIHQRINEGLVYVPEDRHKNGIFSLTSIQNNISSTILHRLSKFLLPFQQEKAIATKFVSELQVKATCVNQEVKDLSGGNQQKVVLSKYLAATPKVIILDEPTRGIDAGARKDIYRIIQELKQDGLAVLLISSDMEEIESLSDRVMVMHEGNLVKTLEKEDIQSDTITRYAFGVGKEVIT
ncbi:sugar ABC transporter ATP-binding protein [Bacillus sp. DJP31]|uniref:sugar ABC transporter ATP-binding protein n=1 Tax=Bacillus sp. DJP31 TaxID=3409789 RepID=UPI003BB7F4FF